MDISSLFENLHEILTKYLESSKAVIPFKNTKNSLQELGSLLFSMAAICCSYEIRTILLEMDYCLRL